MTEDIIVMRGTELRALLLETMYEALRQHKQQEVEQSSQYLTCKQAAAFLGKTPNAIRQMVSKEQIKYIKKDTLLYFRNEDLISYLESGNIKDEGNIIKMKGGANA